MKLTPAFVVLKNSSKISADAVGGPGGNIYVSTNGIFNFSDEPLEDVITASSQRNVAGVVDIHSPDVDVSRLLLGLSTHFLNAAEKLRPPCGEQQGINQASSHFHVIYLSGYPKSPESWGCGQ